ncbi:fibronectin type 3 and ankyrin repeat domains 1 protein-like isoform X2 [Lineus longissimus]|uniref:fibronectin type 3 and ankyrin repeat domains 1 protein-like isoform X2 n=1 Tax=Lineus longissimus TaxID=88925 RepID=UPI002B4F5244
MSGSADPPPRPPPPTAGAITHYNIELQWADALERVNEMMSTRKGDNRTKVVLQQEDKRGNWDLVYSGYSKRTVVDGLEPLSKYRFRLQFKTAGGSSDWSAPCSVATRKEPLTTEHLHRAVNRADLMEIEKVIASGDVNIETPDKYGFTALMQASQKGHKSVCELLISKGAYVDEPNESYKTALMLAAYSGRMEIVELLREHSAKYDTRDKGGSAPLHYAVDGSKLDVIRWMMEDGADVNITDNTSGWTPLMRVAAVTGNRDVAKLLINKGATVDHKDKDGKTALMVAVVNGHQPLVELLLDHKADIYVQNEYGKNAFDMAHSLERQGVIRTIERHVTKIEQHAQ